MVIRIPEFAVILAMLTLSQRYTGYENKALGYILGLIALACFVLWVNTFIGEFFRKQFPEWRWTANREGSTLSKLVHAGRARTAITWLVCIALMGVVAYPWFATPRAIGQKSGITIEPSVGEKPNTGKGILDSLPPVSPGETVGYFIGGKGNIVTDNTAKNTSKGFIVSGESNVLTGNKATNEVAKPKQPAK